MQDTDKKPAGSAEETQHQLVGGGTLPTPKASPALPAGAVAAPAVADINDADDTMPLLGGTLERNIAVEVVFESDEWERLRQLCPGPRGRRSANAIVCWGVAQTVGGLVQPFNLNTSARANPEGKATKADRVRVFCRVREAALAMLAEVNGGAYGISTNSQLVRWAILRRVLAMRPVEIRERLELRGRPA